MGSTLKGWLLALAAPAWLACALALAGLAADLPWPLELFSEFARPGAWACLAGAMLAASPTGRSSPWFLVSGSALGLMAFGLWVGSSGFMLESKTLSESEPFRIVQANLEGKADLPDLGGADFAALAEVDAGRVDGRLDGLAPAAGALAGAKGTDVALAASRRWTALRSGSFGEDPQGRRQAAWADFSAEGFGELRVVSIHPCSPSSAAKTACRKAFYERLARFCSEAAEPAPPKSRWIVVGDFNASPWNEELKAAEAACGASSSGWTAAARASWPAATARYGVGVPIDGIWLGKAFQLASRTVSAGASDHLSVENEIRFAPPDVSGAEALEAAEPFVN